MSTINKVRLIRFFSSLMFWFGIEQLFLNNVLQDPNARAWTVTAFTVGMIVFNIPGGVFADKFGRKKAMLLGAIVQFVSVLLLGTSTSTLQYAIAALLFGLYFSLENNAASSYLYDYMKSSGNTKNYAKVQGSAFAFAFIAAAIGNVFSGFIADTFDLRMPYLVSLIPIIFMVMIILSLHDQRPEMVKQTKSTHLAQVLKNVRRIEVVLFGMRRILGTIVFLTICEFGQVYLLTFDITTKTLGILWAIVAVVCAAGLLVVKYASRRHESFSVFYALILLAFATIPGPIGIVIFMAVYALNEMLATVSETEIHHVTDSSVRATILSIVTFTGYGVGIAVTWLFNSLHTNNGIVQANNLAATVASAALLITVIAVFLNSLTKRRQIAS